MQIIALFYLVYNLLNVDNLHFCSEKYSTDATPIKWNPAQCCDN